MSQGTSLALMGAGMAAEPASLIGADPYRDVGVGTAQVGASLLLSDNVELIVSSGQTAFIFPGSGTTTNASILNDYWLTNQSSTATSALIYVPVGHYLNGSLNGSLTLAQYKSAIMWQYKAKNWTYLLTA